MIFASVMIFVILQRLVELFIAKRNEKWMLNQGAFEVGAAHYPAMVVMHISFFATLIIEVTLFDRALSPLLDYLFGAFLLLQTARIWCLTSLGRFWNTKIIILPGAEVVRKGPYRFMRHPNYTIVTLELLILPLLFSAYLTTIIFAVLNAWMLSIRIPAEEKALREATDYGQTMLRATSKE
ncbi:isoprenylcysteine carboxyl methyltransferase family protein [Sporosarcina sp. HYO08]|uniref:isoprenylcysteine carboxyl methyltransferase family protein n=1 Tax=Sporosarcina sp. HYO08 TaxID=1759557 RepID=UPI0007994BF7|nr:isoprenylcysteine carboxylmethyltransferase family protein [Sporosarcina sp. HYO08]KXH86889.1 isoprenylcysteine carboxyl methyltransferase [Sporosarcina sp. HYO08]